MTAKHRDVLAHGFEHENLADAVFLDLPAPWDAVEHVMKVLKKTGTRKNFAQHLWGAFRFWFLGGRLCTFSPCIEQVQRTCQRLRANGFEEINTIECLRRVHEFRFQHRSKISFTADHQTEAAAETKPITSEPVEQETAMDTTSLQADATEGEETKSSKRDAVEPVEEDATSHKKLKNGPETTKKRQVQETDGVLTAIGPLVMPGHTGYLTFSYLKQV